VTPTLPCAGGLLQLAPDGAGPLREFRARFRRCLTARGDALFSLCDAVLCAGGRVTDLARLSLVPEFGRGHGALYDCLNAGRYDRARLGRLMTSLRPPAWPDGRIRLAADVTCWLRPEAETSAGRLYCHVRGKGANPGWLVPGWQYSFVAALGPGASSWAPLLDAVRLGPDDDAAAVAARQLREVVARLIAAGHWKAGDPAILIAVDSGYPAARLAWELRDLPVLLVARVREDRVFRAPPPPRLPGAPGRARRHGARLDCSAPATWPEPDITADAGSARLGPLLVMAWHRRHQRLTRQNLGWAGHQGQLPVIEGTVIRLARAGGRELMWLWASDPQAGPEAVARLWQSYLRRFDLEHAFRFLKQQLGWARPLLRDPQAADRWTWLLIAAWNQLWLARSLAAITRLPWQRPQPPAEMTPGRVRAGFRHARQIVGTPASTPKPARPGPGRPKGSSNTTRAPRHPAGKTNPARTAPAKKAHTDAKQTG
jgi:hypothetical protein